MRTLRFLSTVTIFALINALFAWKYVSRTGNGWYVALAVAMVTGIPFLLYIIYTSDRGALLQRVLNSSATFMVLIAGTVIVTLLVFRFFPQENLKVDRFEMIQLFWDNAFSQRCPYCPRTEGTNIPGPFPFYFYAAFPFYLIGEIGLYSLAGLLLFAIILVTAKEFTPRLRNTLLLFLLTSPAFLFELFCRSTNFLNSTMLLFCLLMICRLQTKNLKYALSIGVVTGLVLSTRSFAFLSVALATVFTFKRSLLCKRVFTMTAIALGTFLITFIPVIAVCRNVFLTYNPFTVQASLSPPLVMVTVSLAAVIAAYRSKNIYTLSMINGLVLLLLVAGYSGALMAEHGFKTAIFSNLVDVSYFSLALPFLLFGMDATPRRAPAAS